PSPSPRSAALASPPSALGLVWPRPLPAMPRPSRQGVEPAPRPLCLASRETVRLCLVRLTCLASKSPRISPDIGGFSLRRSPPPFRNEVRDGAQRCCPFTQWIEQVVRFADKPAELGLGPVDTLQRHQSRLSRGGILLCRLAELDGITFHVKKVVGQLKRQSDCRAETRQPLDLTVAGVGEHRTGLA